MLPGDVILLNSPYWNAARIYDATLVSPFFGVSVGAGLRDHGIDVGERG
jgi:N-methylhydantoinase B